MFDWNLKADVLAKDETGRIVKIGEKVFAPADRPLNEWVDRPKGTEVRPPMKSALAIRTAGGRLDRLSADALGFLVSTSNDVQHSTQAVTLFSGPENHGDGWSVTPDNFLQSLTVFAARKLVKPTWLSWQDQFSTPTDEALKSTDFQQWQLDAVVWSLFHGKNHTSSLGNVRYKGKTYDIRNQFFWMAPAAVSAFADSPRVLSADARRAKTPFVADWLERNRFSHDAAAVLAGAVELVRLAAPSREDAEERFQLLRWDAGWYQLEKGIYKNSDVERSEEQDDAFEDFTSRWKMLGDRLRPGIYEWGFLPSETLLEEGS
jgi:hypothetical protein